MNKGNSMSKLRRCKAYKTALSNTIKLYDDWAAGRITVVLSGDTDGVTTFTLDEISAIFRNYALAALGYNELVPGTPEQHFPLHLGEVHCNYVPVDAGEEPEGY